MRVHSCSRSFKSRTDGSSDRHTNVQGIAKINIRISLLWWKWHWVHDGIWECPIDWVLELSSCREWRFSHSVNFSTFVSCSDSIRLGNFDSMHFVLTLWPYDKPENQLWEMEIPIRNKNRQTYPSAWFWYPSFSSNIAWIVFGHPTMLTKFGQVEPMEAFDDFAQFCTFGTQFLTPRILPHDGTWNCVVDRFSAGLFFSRICKTMADDSISSASRSESAPSTPKRDESRLDLRLRGQSTTKRCVSCGIF